MSWQNCIGSNMAASLATQTIWDALITEKVTGGLTIHGDQGSQYTSTAYFDLSKEYHFRLSMSIHACPYENAAMEIFLVRSNLNACTVLGILLALRLKN